MRIARLGALVVTLTFATPAEAGPRTVVLVGEHPRQPLLVQLEDELTLLGLEPRSVIGPKVAELGALAIENDARAVVYVEADSSRILISVEADAPGSGRRDFVITPPAGAAPDGRLLALRAVELLRGLLLKVERTTQEPHAGEPAPSAASGAPPLVARSTARSPPANGPQEPRRNDPVRRESSAAAAPGVLSLLLAPAVALSPGGVAPGAGLKLAAEYRFLEWLGIEPSVFLPAGATEADAPRGALDVRILTAGAALRASTALGTRVSLGVAAGTTALWTRWEQTTSAAAQRATWTAVPFLGANGTLWLHPTVGLRLDSLVGWSLRTIELETTAPIVPGNVPVNPATPERSHPVFAQPLLLLSLGLEVRL